MVISWLLQGVGVEDGTESGARGVAPASEVEMDQELD
jgi:hypothetical protein